MPTAAVNVSAEILFRAVKECMKKSVKIAFSALLAALAAAFMVGSLFPYLTYAIAAFASLFIMVVVIELGVKWGLAAYIVSAVLVLLLPSDPEAKLIYLAVTGYHPILKSVLESKCSRPLEYILKFAVLNSALLLSYGLLAELFGIDMSDMGDFGTYSSLILLAAANVVYFIYDIMVTRMAVLYNLRLHKAVSRIINKK